MLRMGGAQARVKIPPESSGFFLRGAKKKAARRPRAEAASIVALSLSRNEPGRPAFGLGNAALFQPIADRRTLNSELSG
jgi:hypothetical protein